MAIATRNYTALNLLIAGGADLDVQQRKVCQNFGRAFSVHLMLQYVQDFICVISMPTLLFTDRPHGAAGVLPPVLQRGDPQDAGRHGESARPRRRPRPRGQRESYILYLYI